MLKKLFKVVDTTEIAKLLSAFSKLVCWRKFCTHWKHI